MPDDRLAAAVADLSDPLSLAKALIACPSVTPADEGALDLVETALARLGFVCTRHTFGEVDNLYAKLGVGRPCLAYVGHTDVVPPGDPAAWTHPPFEPVVADGLLWGRGSADMKGGIAAFVAGVARFLETAGSPEGAIAVIITGDEEAVGIDGVKRLLPVLAAEGEVWDHALGGEPTSHAILGDIIKIGRRGSLNGRITVRGRQGHVAYPDRARNPIPPLLELLARLLARPLDDGAERFQPSNLEITSIDVGNPAHNVIPARAEAKFNIRFNTRHDGESLLRWIKAERAAVKIAFDGDIDLDLKVTGEAFLTEESAFTALVQDEIEAALGRRPALSTSGGTSDARFMKEYAPIVELGPVGASIHKVDEHVSIADLDALADIYARILARYFADVAPRPDADPNA